MDCEKTILYKLLFAEKWRKVLPGKLIAFKDSKYRVGMDLVKDYDDKTVTTSVLRQQGRGNSVTWPDAVVEVLVPVRLW